MNVEKTNLRRFFMNYFEKDGDMVIDKKVLNMYLLMCIKIIVETNDTKILQATF